jgi:hypothetical protein
MTGSTADSDKLKVNIAGYSEWRASKWSRIFVSKTNVFGTPQTLLSKKLLMVKETMMARPQEQVLADFQALNANS